MWLFLAFLSVPLIEITLFIQIGGLIGLGWTLLIVVATAILGTWLVRHQGILALGQVRDSFSRLQDPTEPLANGAMILFSGALLLTPGFFTDAVGFLLLIPSVRAHVYKALRARVKVATFQAGPASEPGRRSSRPDIIEAEFTDITPDEERARGSSGWTKH